MIWSSKDVFNINYAKAHMLLKIEQKLTSQYDFFLFCMNAKCINLHTHTYMYTADSFWFLNEWNIRNEKYVFFCCWMQMSTRAVISKVGVLLYIIYRCHILYCSFIVVQQILLPTNLLYHYHYHLLKLSEFCGCRVFRIVSLGQISLK